jgi:hypothetical protein
LARGATPANKYKIQIHPKSRATGKWENKESDEHTVNRHVHQLLGLDNVKQLFNVLKDLNSMLT